MYVITYMKRLQTIDNKLTIVLCVSWLLRDFQINERNLHLCINVLFNHVYYYYYLYTVRASCYDFIVVAITAIDRK